MASIQCFKDAGKTYYQQSLHGNRMGYAMTHRETQCYGQSEKHLPLGQGYTARGHGHMARAHGHHSGHAMAKTKIPCMGQNNGHHLGQPAETRCSTKSHGSKENYSSYYRQSKKMGGYEEEKIVIKKKSKSGDSRSTQSYGYKKENSSCHMKSKKKGQGYMGHGHGHMARAHGHHTGLAMANVEKVSLCMAENKHLLVLPAQTTPSYGLKKENSYYHMKSKKRSSESEGESEGESESESEGESESESEGESVSESEGESEGESESESEGESESDNDHC